MLQQLTRGISIKEILLLQGKCSLYHNILQSRELKPHYHIKTQLFQTSDNRHIQIFESQELIAFGN